VVETRAGQGFYVIINYVSTIVFKMLHAETLDRQTFHSFEAEMQAGQGFWKNCVKSTL